MKVAKNDPGLAHALALAVLKRNIERDARFFHTHRPPPDMKGMFNDLKKFFGERVVIEYAVREEGSRAEGYLAVLTPELDGLRLTIFSWIRGRTDVGDMPIEVSPHVLARMIQRTVGRDVLGACCAKLRPFMLGCMNAFNQMKKKNIDERLIEGSELTVVGQAGALIFVMEDGVLRGKTWLDAGMMADRELREVTGQLDGDTFECRWVMAPQPQLVH